MQQWCDLRLTCIRKPLPRVSATLLDRSCIHQRAAESHVTVWKNSEMSFFVWVLGKTKHLEKNALGIVCYQRAISTLGQRSKRRKCWNSPGLVTALIAKDGPHGCRPIIPSSHPTDMLSARWDWHRGVVPRFSVASLNIIQLLPQPKAF